MCENKFAKFKKKENNEKTADMDYRVSNEDQNKERYINFFREMRLQDREKHFNYMKMSKKLFNILLSKVVPHITKNGTKPRSYTCRRKITLQFRKCTLYSILSSSVYPLQITENRW